MLFNDFYNNESNIIRNIGTAYQCCIFTELTGCWNYQAQLAKKQNKELI